MNKNSQPDLPEPKPAGNYIVPMLGLDHGTFIFTYLSTFISYITPHDLPVELLRDAFQTRFSILQLIMEALKVESGFICLIVIFFIISIIPLLSIIVYGCSRSAADDISGEQRALPVDALMTLDEAMGNTIHCRKRILQILLYIVIGLLMTSVTAIFITNEQLSVAFLKTPNVVKASLKDVDFFLKDAHKQITFSVHEGINTAIERIKLDFEEIDKLVGIPIQDELEAKTELSSVFQEIVRICSANYEIIHRIQLLHDGIARAILMAHEATTRTDELQMQLSVLQRQCTIRDRPLCETLTLKTFHENNFMETLIKLQTDPYLFKMLTLGEHEVNGVTRNLSTELQIAQSKFLNFSEASKEISVPHRDAIYLTLADMKDTVQMSMKVLSGTTRSIIDKVDKAWSHATKALDAWHTVGNILWIIFLITAIVILFITLLLIIALSYGCCNIENRAGITLIIGASSITIGSLGLVLLTTFIMLVGGHGEVFICRPLYDVPNYNVITKLFDKPGMVFMNEHSNGLFQEIIKPPEHFPNITLINVTLSNVINKCQENGASYQVFELENIFNISKLMNLNEFPYLLDAIEKFQISTDHFSTITEFLQKLLEFMYVNSKINLPTFRTKIIAPTLEKDLSIFIELMQRVSLQIQDVATSSRITTLVTRARRLQTAILQPLEDIRNDIIFQLTAMELQREPWANQVNQSLLHLKSVQYYLNHDAPEICSRKVDLFKERLKGHLVANTINIKSILTERIASCRPLYNIFDANRRLLCRHTMDPLNGLWFVGLICLLLWSIATPLTLALANIYKRLNNARGLRHTNSHQYGAPTDSLIISEQSNWAAERQGSLRSIRWETTSLSNEDDD